MTAPGAARSWIAQGVTSAPLQTWIQDNVVPLVLLGIAIILMVVSELIGADNGVGYVVQLAQRGFDIPEMWAGTLLLGLLGFGANALFVAVEKRVLHWHIATTGRASGASRRRSRRPTPKPTEAAGARRP